MTYGLSPEAADRHNHLKGEARRRVWWGSWAATEVVAMRCSAENLMKLDMEIEVCSAMEVALGWPLGSLEPDGSGAEGPCPESSSPLTRPSDFKSVVPLNLYPGSLHLTVEGAIEAYAAGTCESSRNASVFATKFLRPLLHVNPLYRSSSLAIQHRFFGFLLCDTNLTTTLPD
ncbi:hypothetical protein U1Q18_036510 [Sarracenia purpurea var. burkii]